MTASEILRGTYVTDLLAQPEAVRATVDQLRVSNTDIDVTDHRYRPSPIDAMNASVTAIHFTLPWRMTFKETD